MSISRDGPSGNEFGERERRSVLAVISRGSRLPPGRSHSLGQRTLEISREDTQATRGITPSSHPPSHPGFLLAMYSHELRRLKPVNVTNPSVASATNAKQQRREGSGQVFGRTRTCAEPTNLSRSAGHSISETSNYGENFHGVGGCF